MALSSEQKSSMLFKKLMGVSETTSAREFFEEPFAGRQMVLPDQLWAEASKIPLTAPTLANEEFDESMTVQRIIDKPLQLVPGTSNSFYHEDLIDAIPFNFGNGSYNYEIKNRIGKPIAFGQGDWVVDIDSGVLTFYGKVPSFMPPKISFYKYVGKKGIRDQRIVISSTPPENPEIGTILFQLEE